MKIRKPIAYTLILAMLIAIFPAIGPTHTAEAVVSSTYCEHGGSTKEIGDAGCSYCGGSGRRYWDGPQTGRNDINPGNGYEVIHNVSWDYAIWDVYYRCQNCGDTGYDCKAYSEEIYRICVSSPTNTKYRKGYKYEGFANGRGQAEGYVPIRWCTHCGPVLASKNQTYETVAKWAQLHLDPEPTPAPEYTVKINIVPEGAGIPIGEGTYKVGSSVTVNASENIGWKFVGWQGVTSGLKNGNKSFNTGPVANTFHAIEELLV